MFRIAVCEDNQSEADAAKELLCHYDAAHPDLAMRTRYFGTGAELLAEIAQGARFDLIFLDIVMPGQNGIEVARELRAGNEETPLVFLTSSADYALDAFGVKATQYLLKPVQRDAFFQVIDDVTAMRQNAQDNFFMVQTPKSRIKLRYSSIVCVESFRRTLVFHLAGGQKLASKTIRVPIEIAVAPLLEDSRFLHAHKSYIINMAFVEELTPTSFLMKNGLEVPVPRYKYAEAKNHYLSYLSESGVVLLGTV